MLTLLSREPYLPPPAVEVCISQYQPCCFPPPWDTNGKFKITTIIIVLLLYLFCKPRCFLQGKDDSTKSDEYPL